MTEFFLNIVNMSISASWIVLAVLLLRLLLKKAPKWITVLLWGIVGVRLICPFTIESALSLIPSAQTINPKVALSPPAIDSGVPIIDNIVNPVIGGATVSFQPEKDLNFFEFIMPYLAGLWLVGIVALLIYTLVSFLRLKSKIGTAVLLRDNIYQSEAVVSPFVLGIIKPKIYLPFNMNEQDMEHVIAHEKAHLRRKDHWWKPLGFLILTLHWFNPLMWLGYVLLCRDIELACDEKVIKDLNTEQKADYSQALLTCSVNRRMISACPLAFGEVGVKDRVKSVLNYKKPAFWIIVVAIVASVVVAVCFLTNPINTSDKVLNKLKNLEDYEVVEQDKKNITLSIPISDLPDSIYTESGKEFSQKEVIAYQDATTSIYLKEARYSNEGKDNLYFCFDFSFDLPKEQGSLLYPYEITDNGLTDSVRTVDGVLKADNGEFLDAVNDRGQGSFNLIWFYVSTDALKQAQGTIRFDVELNQITYWLDGDDYGSISNVGGADGPNNITVDSLEKPPTMIVSCGKTSVNAWLGTYSWLYKNSEDGTAQAVNADSSHPLYQIDDVAILPILPTTMSSIDPLLASLQFAVVPDKIEVKCYKVDSKDTNNSEAISVKGTTFKLKEGKYLYEVIAEWTKSEKCSGKACYAFQTIKPNLEIIDTQNIEKKITAHATKDTYLYANSELTDIAFSIPKGTDVVLIETDTTKGSAKAIYDEYIGWIPSINLELGKANNQTISQDEQSKNSSKVESDLTAAIAKVLNEKYQAIDPDGLLHIETYYLLANETASGTPLKGNSGHMEKATVYLLVYHMKYSVGGGQLEEVEGGFVPTAITFAIDENGQYTFEEYWVPRTGANYEKDIRAKFPGESANEALNTEKYAEDLIKESWRLATETLKSLEVENE